MNARQAAETVVKQYVLLQPFCASKRSTLSLKVLYFSYGYAFVISLIIFDKFRFYNDEKCWNILKV